MYSASGMTFYDIKTDEDQLAYLKEEIKIFRYMANKQLQLNVKYSKETDETGAFSDLANLCKVNADQLNSNAVCCILEMHALIHKNPDLLDLHELQVHEAAECLDDFIDTHIEQLRKDKITYKILYVITGRGNRSPNGHSKIKANSQNRLLERHLMKSERNPGFLEVAVYATSLLSTVLKGG